MDSRLPKHFFMSEFGQTLPGVCVQAVNQSRFGPKAELIAMLRPHDTCLPPVTGPRRVAMQDQGYEPRAQASAVWRGLPRRVRRWQSKGWWSAAGSKTRFQGSDSRFAPAADRRQVAGGPFRANRVSLTVSGSFRVYAQLRTRRRTATTGTLCQQRNWSTKNRSACVAMATPVPPF